jgi:GNAT superfamily N-acetyltransferase
LIRLAYLRAEISLLQAAAEKSPADTRKVPSGGRQFSWLLRHNPPAAQQSGYIDHFFVAAGATRQGVGSLLMDRIHVTALSAGLQSLFSDVSVTARPFFEHWGFEVEGRQSLVVNGVSLANFRMRKSRLTFKWSRRS